MITEEINSMVRTYSNRKTPFKSTKKKEEKTTKKKKTKGKEKSTKATCDLEWWYPLCINSSQENHS